MKYGLTITEFVLITFNQCSVTSIQICELIPKSWGSWHNYILAFIVLCAMLSHGICWNQSNLYNPI